ncbi:hypothetical protein D3C73_951890 [compost metagenome]
MRQQLRIQLEDVAKDDFNIARHVVRAVDGFMRHGPQLVFGEELFHRKLGKLDAQHRVPLRRQPHHVQRFAAQRHQYPSTLRYGQRGPVLLQERRNPGLMKVRAPFAPAFQPEFCVHVLSAPPVYRLQAIRFYPGQPGPGTVMHAACRVCRGSPDLAKCAGHCSALFGSDADGMARYALHQRALPS